MPRFSLQTLLAAVTVIAVFLGGFCFARNDGGLIKTGKPLDLAIVGDGYFQIELENTDRTLYTRYGHFHLDANGTLGAGSRAMEDAQKLFPNVTVPQGANLRIRPNGTTVCYWAGRPESITIGTIQLATFANPSGLRQVTDNLYEATDESGCPNVNNSGISGIGLIRSGCLERPLSEAWLADVKFSHVLTLAIVLAGGFLLLKELRTQRQALARLQTLLAARSPQMTAW